METSLILRTLQTIRVVGLGLLGITGITTTNSPIEWYRGRNN